EGNAESENNQATAYDVASVGHRLPRYRLYAASRLVNHSQSLKVCRVRLPLELASACFHTNCIEFLTVLSGIGAAQHRDAVRRLRHIRFANARMHPRQISPVWRSAVDRREPAWRSVRSCSVADTVRSRRESTTSCRRCRPDRGAYLCQKCTSSLRGRRPPGLQNTRVLLRHANSWNGPRDRAARTDRRC